MNVIESTVLVFLFFSRFFGAEQDKPGSQKDVYEEAAPRAFPGMRTIAQTPAIPMPRAGNVRIDR